MCFERARRNRVCFGHEGASRPRSDRDQPSRIEISSRPKLRWEAAVLRATTPEVLPKVCTVLYWRPGLPGALLKPKVVERSTGVQDCQAPYCAAQYCNQKLDCRKINWRPGLPGGLLQPKVVERSTGVQDCQVPYCNQKLHCSLQL